MRTANNNMYQVMPSLNTSFYIYIDFFNFHPSVSGGKKGLAARNRTIPRGRTFHFVRSIMEILF